MSSEIDPRFVERLSRDTGRTRSAPDLSAALDVCSKQFQLWDVQREEIDLVPARLERVLRGRPLEAAGPGFQAIAADCTRELVRLVTASTLALKGYSTFRTMKRLLLRRPYKTDAAE